MGEIYLRLLTLAVSGIFINTGNNYYQHEHYSGQTGHLANNSSSGRGAIGGFVNYLCPMNVEGIKTFSSCDIECKGQHGTVGGTCGNWHIGDYNCYCEESTGRRNEKSLQCGAKTQNFRDVCKTDCICNHSASGGLCDFERKACICQNVGKNQHNYGCPYKNRQEINDFFSSRLGIREEDLEFDKH